MDTSINADTDEALVHRVATSVGLLPVREAA